MKHFVLLSIILIFSSSAVAQNMTRISKVPKWSKLLTIQGEVVRLRGDEIRVRDRSGAIWVQVGEKYRELGIEEGVHVRVFGERDAVEFDAYQIIVGDGQPKVLKMHYLHNLSPLIKEPKYPSPNP